MIADDSTIPVNSSSKNEIDDKEIESYFKQLRAEFLKLDIHEPDALFFSKWVAHSTGGRDAYFINPTEDNWNCLDLLTTNKAKTWLFTFPDFREDYLIERYWDKLKSINASSVLEITFSEEDEYKYDFQEKHCRVALPKKFLDTFNGLNIEKQMIWNMNQNNFLIKEELRDEDLLNVALGLRYDKSMYELQAKGILDGFKFWINDGTKADPLTGLFGFLYGDGDGDGRDKDPLLNPDKAQRFMFMWQNFSFIYPDSSYVLLFFNKDNHTRLCTGMVWNDYSRKVGHKVIKLANLVFKLQKKIADKQKVKSSEERRKKRGKSDRTDKWDIVKNNKKYRILWDSKISKKFSERITPLMRLIGKLAFFQHEGKSTGFSFIAGTERIFPVISEIVALDMFSDSASDISDLDLNFSEFTTFEPGLYKQICEANYSLFSVPRVVGFFNTEEESITKILRLRAPSEEDSRLRGDPIIDQDCLFCWALERIYKEQDTESIMDSADKALQETCFVSTKGDGKVRIYCYKDNIGELVLLWDVARGELLLPLGAEEEDEAELKRVIKYHLGIKEGDLRFQKITKVIRKISANVGEGAAIILAKEKTSINDYLTKMELLEPSWLRNLNLDGPHYLMHAAFITDGACLVTKASIKPRQAIYPHNKIAWGLRHILKDDRVGNASLKLDIIRKLSGKGSKTHGSANVSTLMKLNRDLEKPEVVVISISADGPIRIWPNYLLKKLEKK